MPNELALQVDAAPPPDCRIFVKLTGHLAATDEHELKNLASDESSWPLQPGQTGRFSVAPSETLGELLSLTVRSESGGLAKLSSVRATGASGEKYLLKDPVPLSETTTSLFYFDHSALKEVPQRQRPSIPDIDAWLAANPRVAAALQWAPPTGHPVAYPQWPAEMKQELARFYGWLQEGRPLGFIDPPLLAQRPETGQASAVTAISETDARRIYLGNVARSIYSETQLPWSLNELSDEGLAVLFGPGSTYEPSDPHEQDGRQTAIYQALNSHDWTNKPMLTAPGDASWNHSFLERHNLIGPSRFQTIVNVCRWIRYNVRHILGVNPVDPPDIFFRVYGYPAFPTAKRILDGSHRQLGNLVSGGCHGTSYLLQQLLRTVNIPVVSDVSTAHSQTRFLSEQLALSHGDDPYTGPDYVDYPVEELLIPEPLYLAHFRRDVWEVGEKAAFEVVGRQAKIVNQELKDAGRAEVPRTGFGSIEPSLIADYPLASDGEERYQQGDPIPGKFDDGLVLSGPHPARITPSGLNPDGFTVHFFFQTSNTSSLLIGTESGALALLNTNRGLALGSFRPGGRLAQSHPLTSQVPARDTWHKLIVSCRRDAGVIRVMFNGRGLPEVTLGVDFELEQGVDALRVWRFSAGGWRSRGKISDLQFYDRALSLDEMNTLTGRARGGGSGWQVTNPANLGFRREATQRQDRYWCVRGRLPLEAPATVEERLWVLPRRNPLRKKLRRLALVKKLELPESGPPWIIAEYVGIVLEHKGLPLTAPLQELDQASQDYVLSALEITETPDPAAPQARPADKYAHLLPQLPIAAPAGEAPREWKAPGARPMTATLDRLDRVSHYASAGPDRAMVRADFVGVCFKGAPEVPLQLLSEDDQAYVLNRLGLD